MSLLGGNDLKDQQKINGLELKINKKLTRQKILLGAFMIELLDKDQVEELGQYTADNLGTFLSRQGDNELIKELKQSKRKKARLKTKQSRQYHYQNSLSY